MKEHEGKHVFLRLGSTSGRSLFDAVRFDPLPEPVVCRDSVDNDSPKHDAESSSNAGDNSTHSDSTCDVKSESGGPLLSPKTPDTPKKPLHPKLLNVSAQLEMKSLWDEPKWQSIRLLALHVTLMAGT
ncbi:hypothetical protein C0Q70_08382 [Pomacea canaliculata]|uniref:Uncharacterized protein n=1 Tax=Pomacea canaliculata TaxID=400727 RepID=A0A2T7PHN8_POMCA|nr:hypothetical protein C0Q70_08382 [Pomacea canaliculata]